MKGVCLEISIDTLLVFAFLAWYDTQNLELANQGIKPVLKSLLQEYNVDSMSMNFRKNTAPFYGMLRSFTLN